MGCGGSKEKRAVNTQVPIAQEHGSSVRQRTPTAAEKRVSFAELIPSESDVIDDLPSDAAGQVALISLSEDSRFKDHKLTVTGITEKSIEQLARWTGAGNGYGALREVERWDTTKKIGGGGGGTVFLQKKMGSAECRAVKVVPKDLRKKTEIYLRRELETLIKVQKDPERFVRFDGWYEDSRTSTTYIVMEYLSEGDLDNFIEKERERAKVEIREIIRQILEGLQVMHSLDTCHRDMKPENILLASRQPLKLKLADFGISKLVSPNAPAKTTKMGTSPYMAPERYGAHLRRLGLEEYTNAVDIWSVGAIAHQIFTGLPPFCEDTTGQNETSHSGVVAASNKSSITFSHDSGDYWQYARSEEPVFPIGLLKKASSPDGLTNFIRHLMMAHPDDRPSASEALYNGWLCGRRGASTQDRDSDGFGGPEWSHGANCYRPLGALEDRGRSAFGHFGGGSPPSNDDEECDSRCSYQWRSPSNQSAFSSTSPPRLDPQQNYNQPVFGSFGGGPPPSDNEDESRYSHQQRFPANQSAFTSTYPQSQGPQQSYNQPALGNSRWSPSLDDGDDDNDERSPYRYQRGSPPSPNLQGDYDQYSFNRRESPPNESFSYVFT